MGMNKWVIALLWLALAPQAWSDDTKERLAASARVLIEDSEALLSQDELPLEGKRSVEAAMEWIGTAEEARKRRNFRAASRAQANASLELDIARVHLRTAQLAVLKRELEAVVQELSDRVDGGGSGE